MITAEMIISAFIVNDMYMYDLSKRFRKDLKRHTPFEMFKGSIADFYNYKGSNTNFKAQYSFGEFINLFYDVVCYDEELPEDMQEKIISYLDDDIKEKVDSEIVNSALNEIRACITQERLDNTVKDFWIKDNDQRTKKVRDLLFNHRHECNSASLVRPLITWAENHSRLNHQFIYKIFEYGYITGKRAERARKKTV